MVEFVKVIVPMLYFWSRKCASTSIYWHSCGLKAEQLDKTRKGLTACKQHNKPMKGREGSAH